MNNSSIISITCDTSFLIMIKELYVSLCRKYLQVSSYIELEVKKSNEGLAVIRDGRIDTPANDGERVEAMTKRCMLVRSSFCCQSR